VESEEWRVKSGECILEGLVKEFYCPVPDVLSPF